MSFAPHLPLTPATVSAVRCADYDPARLREAVESVLAPLGGLKAFVSPGSTVLLKPNLVSPHPPEDAVTTHPALVEVMAGLCRDCGVRTVLIGDSPAGAHDDAILWERTGMREVASRTGAELRSFTVRDLNSIDVGGERVPVPKWLDEVDTVISLPKLKTHTLTALTCATKNVFGLVVGEAKSMAHARHPSPTAMSVFLANVYTALRPHLTLVDAITAMEGEGPTNGRPRQVDLILAGADAAAIDAVCARTLGVSPHAIPMLRTIRELDAGETRLANIAIVGDGATPLDGAHLKPSMARWLQRIPESIFKPATYVLASRPRVRQKHCVKCGACARICSQQAIEWDEVRAQYRVHKERCILCMCCLESCPHQAIEVRSPLLWLSKLSGRRRYRR